MQKRNIRALSKWNHCHPAGAGHRPAAATFLTEMQGAIASRNKARIEAVLALLVEAMPVEKWSPELIAAHVE